MLFNCLIQSNNVVQLFLRNVPLIIIIGFLTAISRNTTYLCINNGIRSRCGVQP